MFDSAERFSTQLQPLGESTNETKLEQPSTNFFQKYFGI